MKRIIVLAVSIHLSIHFICNANANDLLEAISQVESGANDFAVGARGERGRFQIQTLTWSAYSKSRNYTDAKVSRDVAERHLHFCRTQFRDATGRDPSDFDAAVMWTAGFAGYRRKDFKPERLTRSVRNYATRVVNIQQNTK